MRTKTYLFYSLLVSTGSFMSAAQTITLDQFKKLKPAQKIDAYNKLTPEDKKNMLDQNLNRLRGLMLDQDSSTSIKECDGCYFENVTLEKENLSRAIIIGAVFNNVTIASC